MALLKSKAAKLAAQADATRILEAAPASAQGSAADWSISQLSALYTEHRTQLVSQARRITRDEAEANEVVQEAFLKFMLAAPELDSADRAIAYLRTSVTNLSLNIIRARGARPNLVAIDADTTQERLNEIASENHIDLDTSITAAEDAAIIREALSRLTSDQRTALVMWEMEGRTTEEIATALNTSPANVRHILVRARKSMVRVLEEWVVDDATGLTALNALSTTYKKAAQIAQKSSKAALSLLLVITAFLGFNSMTGNEGSVVSTLPSVTAVTEKAPAATSSQSPTAAAATKAAVAAATKKAQIAALNAKIAALSFFGLNKDGIPTGFTVTDSTGSLGSLYITNRPPVLSETELILSQVAKTDSGAANIFISQQLVSDSQGFSYLPSISYGKDGAWVPLVTKLTYLNSERMLSGDYLVTAIIKVESEVETPVVIPASASGRDLLTAPRQVITRLVLNPGKTQILSQAVYVVEKGVK